MDELTIETLKRIIQDNGVNDTLRLLASALREISDEYSDLLLKEKSVEAAETSEMLVDICNNHFDDLGDDE